jgi:hypothetical protein
MVMPVRSTLHTPPVELQVLARDKACLRAAQEGADIAEFRGVAQAFCGQGLSIAVRNVDCLKIRISWV